MKDNQRAGGGAVKSAQRILEILEYISERQTSITVKEVSDALGYPQSSTSYLLNTLSVTGYLSQDRTANVFQPTARVMLIGAWMQDKLFSETSILSLMEKLKRETGCAVLLGMRHEGNVRFIYLLPSDKRNGLKFPKGTVFPLLQSTTGRTLLSAESDAEIQRVLRLYRNDYAETELTQLFYEIQGIKKMGWYAEVDNPQKRRCGISRLLPRMGHHPQLAITVGYSYQSSVDEWEAKKPFFLEKLN